MRACLHIVGAGPAGLAAAITAAKAGCRVVVSERRRDVGGRFNGDFQGLENWTTTNDALAELRDLGIEPNFKAIPIHKQICFGPDGKEHLFRSRRPFYYLVRRGSAPETLDQALKQQALSAGVSIQFGETVRSPSSGSISALGPRRADAMAIGYLFETDFPDGCFAVLCKQFAPGGYGYFLVHAGHATLAVCLFKDFQRGGAHLARTVRFFQDRLGFGLRNVRRFGGVGNVHFAPPQALEQTLRAGEASGAQDALWGFGIRHAIRSGVLAASYGNDFQAYQRLWDDKIGSYLRVSVVNRFGYECFGELGYRFLLYRLARAAEPWKVLHRLYAPVAWKQALFSLIHFFQNPGPWNPPRSNYEKTLRAKNNE
jgi:flavin-dependent dehydrogenase